MIFLPSSNSAFSPVLNSSRGRPRRSAARRTRGSRSVSSFGSLPSAWTSKTSTARFNCSTFFFASLPRGSFFPWFRERLGIGTLQARPQTAQGPELQLLHRALGLANLPRHFLYAFLLHKSQHYYSPLLRRQRVDQAKQHCPAFYFFEFRGLGLRGFNLSRFIRHLLPVRSLPAIRNQIRGNSKQPRRKRNAPPFKPPQISQCMMKYFRGQILGFRTISYAPHHIGIHSLEIILVELGKARRVLLRLLNQKPLVRFFPQSLQRILRAE